jgi:hypothetical protein
MAPVLDGILAADLLGHLDGFTWRRKLGSRFCFDVPALSSDYLAFQKFVTSSNKFDTITCAIAEIYKFPAIQLSNIDVHKYERGTGIGAHTDRGVTEFRFVLNLNRIWELSHGGVWILSTTSDLSEQTRYVAPIHNTGFGFRPGVNTYHALSERFVGVAYALVFRF